MQEIQYKIRDKEGIHARPAGALVKLAKEYKSEITCKANGKKADAKKLLALMAMGIKCGDTVTICIQGTDEEAAAKAVEAFLEREL